MEHVLPPQPEKKRTPAMEQYDRIKQQYPEGFLFFQMGDFFELFGEDAVRASQILGLTLTARDKNAPQPLPFAGVPMHAGEKYIAELTRQGHTVVVCEQMTPAGKGVVERAVTRVVTPGTTFSTAVLEEKSSNHMVALVERKGIFGLAWADPSTGDFHVMECATLTETVATLARLAPREVLIGAECFSRDALVAEVAAYAVSVHRSYTPGKPARETLLAHFGATTLAAFGVEESPLLQDAAGMVLAYIMETQLRPPHHMTHLTREYPRDHMPLDWQTLRNLEIFATARDAQRDGSLLSVLDETTTAMGGRLLRRELLAPSTSRERIMERHAQTALLVESYSTTQAVRAALRGVYDMERLLGRLTMGRGNARDMLALGKSLHAVLEVGDLLAAVPDLAATLDLGQRTTLRTMMDQIDVAIAKDPPPVLQAGGIMGDGFNEELDQLRSLMRASKDHLLAYQQREQERTGISTLKVKSTGAFGYFLEVSKSQIAKVPDSYLRKQSLVGAERYTTAELEELGQRIASAESEAIALEYRLFEELRTAILTHTPLLRQTAEAIALLDFLTLGAHLAHTKGYVRPIISTTGTLRIEDGRHPVVEDILRREGKSFVPNSTAMEASSRLHLITGPNMAGKSTYLRQVALICHMAHCGLFVPAKSAEIPLLDRIFTRIGAQDNLTRGQSTFMVEMQEAAHIMHHATERSLIILDEIGRGTSTYDGLSLAWAIAEYAHSKIGALTLFATHYHELIDVVEKMSAGANYSVAVSKQGSGVTFLHAIVPGGAPDSYGIDVAALAGMPGEILTKAEEHLRTLEAGGGTKGTTRKADPNQLSIFAAPVAPARNPAEEEALRSLRDLDPDRMTPREAQEALYRLKEVLE